MYTNFSGYGIIKIKMEETLIWTNHFLEVSLNAG